MLNTISNECVSDFTTSSNQMPPPTPHESATQSLVDSNQTYTQMQHRPAARSQWLSPLHIHIFFDVDSLHLRLCFDPVAKLSAPLAGGFWRWPGGPQRASRAIHHICASALLMKSCAAFNALDIVWCVCVCFVCCFTSWGIGLRLPRASSATASICCYAS